MELTSGLTVVRRFWRSILVVTVLAGVVAYAISFLMSPQYAATSRLLVRAREARFLTSTGQGLSQQPGVIDSVLAKSLGQTTAATIGSRAVAERVVTELHLDQPRPQDPSFIPSAKRAIRQLYRVVTAIIRYGYYDEPSAYEGAVQAVQASLQATPVKDSFLVDVKASADDPQLVAAIANAAVHAITELNQQRFEDDATRYSTFLRSQVERAQKDVDAAQLAVQQYKQSNGISDVGEALKLDAATRDGLSRQLKDAEVEIDAVTAQHQTVQRLLQAQAATDTSTNTIVTGRSSTRTTQVEPNKVFQDLQSKDADLKAQIAYLEAKRDALTTVLSSASASELPAQEARLGTLTAQLQTALDMYKNVRSTYELALQTSAQGAVEVSEADRASPPLYPEKPLRWLYALFGLLFGLAGGVGLGTLRSRRGPGRSFAAVGEADGPVTAPLPQPAFSSHVSASAADQTSGSRWH